MSRAFLTILTYVRAGSDSRVRNRLPTALASLRASRFPGPVWIVDDGSDDPEHQAYLKRLRVAGHYNVFHRAKNGGVAKAKNTCLRLFRDSRYEIGFIAEDDILFRRPYWWRVYEQAHDKTGIHHFSFALPEYELGRRTRLTDYACPLVKVNRLNGILLVVTQKVLSKIGGMRMYPVPWGAEHSQFTARAVRAKLCPGFVDVVAAGSYLGLNRFADASVVSRLDRKKYARILRAYRTNTTLFWPLQE